MVQDFGGNVSRFILAIAFLLLNSWPSAALDAKVATELERFANGPAGAARDIAAQLQNELFNAIEESCLEQQDAPPGQCQYSRLLGVLDHSGLLRERCASVSDSRALTTCVISGADALPIVDALGGDPRKDIDWVNADDSYFRLRDALKDSARERCAASQKAGDNECVIIEQAALLGFPPAAGLGCAKQPGKYDKQGCLDALQTIAVYLSAMNRLLDDSEPL
jgi:hypothetical protein